MRGLCRKIVVLAAAVLMLASCASTESGEWVEIAGVSVGARPTIDITGTIRHLDIEGGVYVIRDASGTSYQPLNLPDAFKVDGLSIDATAVRRDDVASIGMAGTHVELLRLRRRAG